MIATLLFLLLLTNDVINLLKLLIKPSYTNHYMIYFLGGGCVVDPPPHGTTLVTPMETDMNKDLPNP